MDFLKISREDEANSEFEAVLSLGLSFLADHLRVALEVLFEIVADKSLLFAGLKHLNPKHPMKIAYHKVLQLGAVSLTLISCQNAPSGPQASGGEAITKPNVAEAEEEQVQISMKLIEITRPLSSSDIPTKRYTRKLSSGEYQILMRQVAQKKDVDIVTAPSVVTMHGKEAKIEVVKEFVYPVDPKDTSKTKLAKLGVTATHTVQRVSDEEISIKSSVLVNEIKDFEQKQADFYSPIFVRRNANFFEKLKEGESLLLGGITDELTQTVEEINVDGSSDVTQEKLSRELLLAVTARSIDLDGSPR